jgi:hypothetical protein
MDAPLVAVEIPMVGDARLKHWAKVVHNVDESKASGWAFDGEFIAAGGVQDVPAGSVVVVYGERGSRANPQAQAQVFVANADATVTPHASGQGRAWARTIRDEVVRLLEEQLGTPLRRRDWGPELLAYNDAALMEELRRRGFSVTHG